MASSPDETAGWGELLASGHAGRLALLSFGVWLHAGDELMVAAITPQIVAGIGGAKLIAWLTALYEVGSIASGAASALIAARLGLRRAMALAALIYLAGCLVSAAAPVMQVMLAGRLIQGMGGGALVALSLIGAWRLFPERLLARVIASVSVVWGVSAFAGPLFGATLASLWDWRAAFLAFAVQAMLFAAAVLRFLPAAENQQSSEKPVFPFARILILAAGVVAIAAAGVNDQPMISALLSAAGLALIAAFVAADQRAGPSRMLPLGAADIATPAGSALLMVFGLSAGTIAFMVYAPVFMAAIQKLNTVQIGLVLTMESVGWTVTSVLVAGISPRRQSLSILSGFGLVIFGVAALALAIPYGQTPAIAACAAAQGAGMGLAWTFVYRRAGLLIGDADRERMTAAISTIQRLAYALGAAYAGIIVNRMGFAHADLARDGAPIATALFLLCLIPALIGYAAAIRFTRFALAQTHGNESG